MRATRGSSLALLLVLAAGCSAEAAQVAAPAEPPPVQATEGLEPPTAGAAPSAAEPAPPGPEAAAPGVAPSPKEAEEDNPLPEGVGARSGIAATAATSSGSTAAAAPAGKPASTGRIEIPAIGLNHLTYEGIDLATINYGPSHWPGKPFPGQVGNTVFPGHRTTYSRPFGDLDKLVPGNQVIFTTPAGRFTYAVTGTTIVSSTDTYVVNNTPDATFTLLACHPKGSAKQRIVVKGKLISPPVVNPAQPPPAPAAPPTTQRRLGLLGLGLL